MKAKKIDTQKITTKVINTLEKVKKSALKANDIALNKTEEIVTETINIAGQLQKVTDKALKSGVQLMENQQNTVFDILETFKSQILDGKRRFKKIFA